MIEVVEDKEVIQVGRERSKRLLASRRRVYGK